MIFPTDAVFTTGHFEHGYAWLTYPHSVSSRESLKMSRYSRHFGPIEPLIASWESGFNQIGEFVGLS